MDNENETLVALLVIMLLGSAKKDAADFDLEAALNRLGFYRREKT
ncbi:hypothetical protein [Pseudomonas aeruginosa]